MATQTHAPETLVDDPGIWFGIATGLVVLTFLIAGLAGLGTAPTAVAVIIVAGLASGRLPGLVALALGVIAWAFFTGFFENTFGQLTFASGDLDRLAVFACSTALVGYLARHALRGSPTRAVNKLGGRS
jgi:hypothetical protein